MTQSEREQIRERAETATPVVAWYAHPYEKQVRGPWSRWFTASGPENSRLTVNGQLEHASIETDVEYATCAMNATPKLLDALDDLDARIAELEHAVSRARVFISRAQSIEEDGEGCKSVYVEKAREALAQCAKKEGA